MMTTTLPHRIILQETKHATPGQTLIPNSNSKNDSATSAHHYPPISPNELFPEAFADSHLSPVVLKSAGMFALYQSSFSAFSFISLTTFNKAFVKKVNSFSEIIKGGMI